MKPQSTRLFQFTTLQPRLRAFRCVASQENFYASGVARTFPKKQRVLFLAAIATLVGISGNFVPKVFLESAVAESPAESSEAIPTVIGDQSADPRAVEDSALTAVTLSISPPTNSTASAATSASAAPRDNSIDRAGSENSPNEDASIVSYLKHSVSELLKSTFEVRQISLRGNQRVANAEVDKLLDLDQPRWVWDVIFEDLPAKLRRNPWIENAQVSWKYFPFVVDVSVQEAEPWLVAEYRGESWLVSRSGKLLQASKTLRTPDAIMETASLPRLDGVELSSAGELDAAAVSRRLEYALRVLRLVDIGGGVPFGVEKYSILPNGGVVISPSEVSIPKVLLAPETFDDARIQLRRLGAVLADLRNRNESAQTVDLRFTDRAFVSS